MEEDPSKPKWLDTGDNAWQLAAATLVGLQSMPGLVILYGSIVKKKWAVNSAFMALYAFAAVLLVWVLVGYRMAFGDKLLPFWGKGGLALSYSYLHKQAALPETIHHYHNGTIESHMTTPEYPMATLVFYQFMFAAITVILLAGSVLGRMNIKAWMLFVPLWVIFSYTVGAFSLWGGGFLYHWGAIDYSGGFVIHLSSGVSGFTAAFWVGPRVKGDKERFSPNNVLLMLAGAGLLWLGWSGFNGGANYKSNIVASVAVLNTNISAATSLLTWTCLDVVFFGKPSVIGAVQGMITGLVCVTPGAGLIQSWAAIVMGIFGGSIPWLTMMILHRKSALLQKVDDTLAVFHTHAVSGLLGGILTAFLAESTLCRMQLPVTNTMGIFYGGGAMILVRQIVAALFVAGWNAVATTAILFFIKLFMSLRMSEDELMRGDDAVHGEEAYCGWGDGEKKQATNPGGADQVTPGETGARGTRFDI